MTDTTLTKQQKNTIDETVKVHPGLFEDERIFLIGLVSDIDMDGWGETTTRVFGAMFSDYCAALRAMSSNARTIGLRRTIAYKVFVDPPDSQNDGLLLALLQDISGLYERE